MKIETFEQTEFVAGEKESAHSDEALEIIARLGLDGQKPSTVEKVRCPYREMNLTEQRVYEVLYPQKVKIAEYSASMIPLRVLQVAAHAETLAVYAAIEVWGERTRPADPLLVGGRGYSKTPHILARWGEALESFDVLHERARKILASRWRAGVEKKKAECDAFLAAIAANVDVHLDGEWVCVP